MYLYMDKGSAHCFQILLLNFKSNHNDKKMFCTYYLLYTPRLFGKGARGKKCDPYDPRWHECQRHIAYTLV
jgi:hypothetical protein